MKYLLITILAILTFSVYGQDEKRHLIGGGFSPEATYRTIKGGNPPLNIDVFGFGYTVGVSYQYNLKWFAAIETGINFSDKAWFLNLAQLSFGDQVDPRRGFIYNSDSENGYGKYDVDMFYLEVPVKFNFYFTKSMVKPFVGIGLLNNFYLTSSRLGGYSRSVSQLPYNLQWLVSAGIDLDFDKKITLRIEPQFKHSLFSIWNKDWVGEYPYSIGCMFALYYRFGK